MPSGLLELDSIGAARYLRAHAIPSAYRLLPGTMASDNATALMLAIGLQESRCIYRRQNGGPARGFFQFERDGGVRGVLRHHRTRPLLLPVLDLLQYPHEAQAIYNAIEDNDVLAVILARLLLWTLPDPLPDRADEQAGWQQYVSAWRPGKPHPGTWSAAYALGWLIATEDA
jgi:hypothetical protein